MQKIVLKEGKDESIKRFHPWIFSGAIFTQPSDLQNGDVVEVYNQKDEYLGTGHYHKGTITVRIFSFRKVNPDLDFWMQKITKSLALREATGLYKSKHTNVFRILHGEGDGCPGLIVDYYNGVAVIQTHTKGMYLMRNTIAEALVAVMKQDITAIYDKSEHTVGDKEEFSVKNEFLYGTSVAVEVIENNNKYLIDFVEGQKTGFFIDQRDNRLLLEQYSKSRSVLNLFCYTGGFSVAALKAGAERVVSVDSSAKAIAQVQKNIELNFTDFSHHESHTEDVFDYMQNIGKEYDTVILDPPAFAKHKDSLDRALKGYRNINRMVMEKMKPNSILFTFSCSQVVSKFDFRMAVFSASLLAHRQVKILHQLTQPTDHPVHICHPEGEYLKGLVLWVE